jgi:L-Ala-D/L-Glu epimerase
VAQERVKVSYILGIADTATMLEDAGWVYSQGVRVLKIKVGRDLSADIERIKALQKHFPDLLLYADANETLGETASSYLQAWADLGLQYVEEPLPVHEVLARQALKKAAILPIIADDSAFTVPNLIREYQLDTFDVLNIKPARSGYTGSLEMLNWASRVMVGSQALSSFGAYQTARLAFHDKVTEPCELSFHLSAGGSFCPFPTIKDGWLYRSDLAQCHFDEQAFKRYAV